MLSSQSHVRLVVQLLLRVDDALGGALWCLVLRHLLDRGLCTVKRHEFLGHLARMNLDLILHFRVRLNILLMVIRVGYLDELFEHVCRGASVEHRGHDKVRTGSVRLLRVLGWSYVVERW